MRRIVLFFATMVGIGACGGDAPTPIVPPPPPANPTLTLSASTLDDTIGAVVATPITVRIARGANAIANTTVRLTSVVTGAGKPLATLGLARFGSFDASLDASTDGAGAVTVFVSLGTVTGNASIAVEAPTLSLRDTVKLIIRPGKVSQVSIAPRDTAVFTDSQLKLRIALRDRAGNAANDSLAVVETTGVAATATSGVFLAGSAVSRGRVVLRSALRTDTIAVSVVPRDTMVFTWWKLDSFGYQVAAVGLDGTIAHTFGPVTTTGPLLNPSYSADGLHAVANYGGNWGSSSDVARLYVYDTTTARTELAPSTAGLTQRLNAHFTHAGDWIFFFSVSTDYSTGVWRIRPDGTGLEQLLSRPVTDYIYGAYPYPDGKAVMVAKISDVTRTQRAFKLDLATRTLTDVGPMNDPFSISPRGDQVAWFNIDTGLWVRTIDGGAARNVSSGVPLVFTPPAWTRDGSYVVADSVLVNVQTGATIPLPWARQPTALFTNPSSRP